MYEKFLEARRNLINDIIKRIYSISYKINKKLPDDIVFEYETMESFSFSFIEIPSKRTKRVYIAADKSEHGAPRSIRSLEDITSEINTVITVDRFEIYYERIIPNTFKEELMELETLYKVIFHDILFQNFLYISTIRKYEEFELPEKVEELSLIYAKQGFLFGVSDINLFYGRFLIIKAFSGEEIEKIDREYLASLLPIQKEEELKFLEIDTKELSKELEVIRDRDFFKKVNMIRNVFKFNEKNVFEIIQMILEGSLPEDKYRLLKRKIPEVFEEFDIPKINSRNLFIKINGNKVDLINHISDLECEG